MYKVSLKSGCNLAIAVNGLLSMDGYGSHSLELMERMTIELLTLPWDVDPQAAFTADGTRALNCKANNVGRLGWRRQVDVTSRDVGMTSIIQGEAVDLLSRAKAGGAHDDFQSEKYVVSDLAEEVASRIKAKQL